jgi:predicted phosphodiesterase
MKLLLTSDTHYGFNEKTQSKHVRFLEKIKVERPDIVIHAGDWASNTQNQFRRTLEMFREKITCPIVCVRGNHDFWQTKGKDKPFLDTLEMIEQHNLWFDELDIHHVSRGELKIEGWSIYGFDGWYGASDPKTNDHNFLPEFTEGLPTMEWFSRKAFSDLKNLVENLDDKKENRICVTHFPSYTDDQRYAHFCANLNYLETLTDYFQIILCGHSHRACDFVFRDTRIVNAGSDYNKPEYKVIEL